MRVEAGKNYRAVNIGERNSCELHGNNSIVFCISDIFPHVENSAVGTSSMYYLVTDINESWRKEKTIYATV